MSKGSLYYLIEEDGRSRQIVNGVVTSLNQKKPLPHAPIGWDDILIIWERNLTRYAQIRNFTLPMGFVRDGALILRNDMYQYNIDRKLYLLIQKLVSTIGPTTFTDRYEFLYKGELDFSTFEDVPGDMRVNMNIMEGGISKLLKANEATQFFIPFDEDAINIKMDGINITGVYKWVIPEYTSFPLGALPTMVLVGNDQKAPGISAFDISGGYTFAAGSIDGTSTPYFLQVTVPPQGGIGTFTGVVNMSNPVVAPAGVFLKIYNTVTGTVRATEDLVNTQEAAVVPINKQVTLLEGDRLFLFIDESHYESTLTLTIETRFPESIIKGFRPITVFKKLCEKLDIPVSNAVSTILEASTIMMTSGDGIRGIEAGDVGIKTSMNDFFKAQDVYEMLGCAVRDIIEIESRLKYFTTLNPVILGEVSDFKTRPATDLMYSSIKVGHREQEIEDVNGKYDFNGYMLFTTPVKRGPGKEMDLVSPYKAGPYEIESIRANLDGRDTTDSDRDNQVFVIACAGTTTSYSVTASFLSSGNQLLVPSSVNLIAGQRIQITGSASNDREYIVQSVMYFPLGNNAVLDVNLTDEPGVLVTIDILSGVIYNLDRSITVTQLSADGGGSPSTIFNVPISPKRLFEKHYRWIRSWCYNYEPEELVFQLANRNSELIAGGVIEKANVPISSMGLPMFKPYYHEFKTKVPVDLVATLDTAPESPFMPTWLGDDYNGFLWRAGISPNSSTPQVYKILSAPDNDLTRLIV